jgi:hypothetical protein
VHALVGRRARYFFVPEDVAEPIEVAGENGAFRWVDELAPRTTDRFRDAKGPSAVRHETRLPFPTAVAATKIVVA